MVFIFCLFAFYKTEKKKKYYQPNISPKKNKMGGSQWCISNNGSLYLPIPQVQIIQLSASDAGHSWKMCPFRRELFSYPKLRTLRKKMTLTNDNAGLSQ